MELRGVDLVASLRFFRLQYIRRVGLVVDGTALTGTDFDCGSWKFCRKHMESLCAFFKLVLFFTLFKIVNESLCPIA